LLFAVKWKHTVYAAPDAAKATPNIPSRPGFLAPSASTLQATENATDNAAVELALSEAAQAALISNRIQWERIRRWAIPLVLFLTTCVSLFFVGALEWNPMKYMADAATEYANFGSSGWFGYGPFHSLRVAILRNWQAGCWYAGFVIAFLFAHEMGHFVAARIYGVPSSFPMVIPFPITPIGTLGAVIVTDQRRADRKMIFDIGIAGPIAGLFVAFPALIYGLMQLNLGKPSQSELQIGLPLVAQWILQVVRPPGYEAQTSIGLDQLNPWFMAGWVGMLVTGLNMMPVSQLDGGHVIHGLFGRDGKWVAWGFLLLAIGACVYYGAFHWGIMITLVLLLGPVHPPTRNDRISLGWFRTLLGWASLVIPIVCFTFQPLIPR
jgi:hypothetical protein